jgi:hypothetical protein
MQEEWALRRRRHWLPCTSSWPEGAAAGRESAQVWDCTRSQAQSQSISFPSSTTLSRAVPNGQTRFVCCALCPPGCWLFQRCVPCETCWPEPGLTWERIESDTSAPTSTLPVIFLPFDREGPVHVLRRTGLFFNNQDRLLPPSSRTTLNSGECTEQIAQRSRPGH